jgi:ABC-type transport system involved in multi-copper enzyme maturation permease subunit
MSETRLRWEEMFPIVRRELRVAAKRRITYRLRWIVALLGAAGVLAAANIAGGYTIAVGYFVFWTASMIMMVVCGAAGLLLTTDSISREKREGTLGLLFLTRLTAADVVLGKLTAGALNGGAVAFAVLPFLAFSLCLGGVTAGELWLMSGALLFLLAFSLTLGIFVSTLMRKEGLAALVFCSLMLAPVGLTVLAIMKWASVPKLIAVSNPFFPAFAVTEGRGFFFPSNVAWQAIAFQSAAIIGMLGVSFIILPWTVKGSATRQKKIKIVPRQFLEWRGKFDTNPVCTLSCRYGHAIALLLICVGMYFVVRFSATTAWEKEVTFLILMTFLPKLFVLWHASGVMAGERQSGFLESLLTTPITGGDVLRGKMSAIKWQVVPSLTFAMLALWWTSTNWWGTKGEITPGATVGLAAMITLLIDVHSIGWVGLWQGLVARDRRRALLWSALLGILGPWVLPGLSMAMLLWLFDGPRWMRDPENVYAPMMISANVISFGIACFAMARLHDRFRSTATQSWAGRGGKASAPV